MTIVDSAPTRTVEVTMEKYLNRGRDSGIEACGIGDAFIVVQFKSGGFYLYTSESVGANNIKRMKALAEYGEGLNAFINTTEDVKRGYADKWQWDTRTLPSKFRLKF